MLLGIGRPPGQMDPVDYVLKNFLPSEHDFWQSSCVPQFEASQTSSMKVLHRP
jgi:peptidyl-tRNA hydrolase